MAVREAKLELFSRTVREVMGRLDPEATTQWLIADVLIRAHPDYGPLDRLLPLGDRPGETLRLEDWLARVSRLLDLEAVARSPSQVIDGRLTLLALARLAPDLDALLRTSRVRWRLEHDLGYPLDDVFCPWALPSAPTDFVAVWSATSDPEAPRLMRCTFSPDSRLLAAAPFAGGVQVWDAARGRRADHAPTPSEASCVALGPGGLVAFVALDRRLEVGRFPPHAGRLPVPRQRVAADDVRSVVFSPAGVVPVLAILEKSGRVLLITPEATTLLSDASGPVTVNDLAFSPDGRRLATAGSAGMLGLWDPLSAVGGGAWARPTPLVCVAFSPDGSLLASTAQDGAVQLTDAGSGDGLADLAGHTERVQTCAFSPDGRLLATGGNDGQARVWDTRSHDELCVIEPGRGAVLDCAFTAGGQLLVVRDESKTVGVWDVASARPVQELRWDEPISAMAVSPEGLLAIASSERIDVYETVEAPGLLPAIVPDIPSGADLLGVGRGADALADVITANGTAPPLSICLLGEWGSGKSFLVNAITERIRTLARRSRGSTRSAYCSNVRNVVFNAWNYADADVPASLVTRIFDVLAEVEDEGAVTDAVVAREQLARLEEELAARSPLQERIERAQLHSRRAEEVRRRLRWARLLTGVDEVTLGVINAGASALSARARTAIVAVALATAVAIGAAAALLGAGRLWQLATAGAGVVVAVSVVLAVVRRHLRGVVGWAGALQSERRAARVLGADDVEAAKEAERELRRERLISERGALAEHRTYLGVLSRIREDLALMSELLLAERSNARPAADPHDARLPPIDRIVVYIDDLDRCPPRRVVEVLEAVHLLLALPLFVVVIAVDPRWLEESLRQHCDELLGGAPSAARDKSDGWRPTPQNFLEKIVQLPFTLRRMRPAAAHALATGLLQVEVPAPHASVPARADGGEGAPTSTAVLAPVAGERPETRAAVAGGDRPRQPAAAGPPSLSPRALALTVAERDFAAEMAALLSTPRAVKKLTNLYRLLRAGLDEHFGELDRFLSNDGPDAAEYEATLILLTAVIAFPEQASDVLLGLIRSPTPVAWGKFVDGQVGVGRNDLATFLQAQAQEGWTTEPFVRWALEVSRYSFETGRRVFATAD